MYHLYIYVFLRWSIFYLFGIFKLFLHIILTSKLESVLNKYIELLTNHFRRVISVRGKNKKILKSKIHLVLIYILYWLQRGDSSN